MVPGVSDFVLRVSWAYSVSWVLMRLLFGLILVVGFSRCGLLF